MRIKNNIKIKISKIIINPKIILELQMMMKMKTNSILKIYQKKVRLTIFKKNNLKNNNKLNLNIFTVNKNPKINKKNN